VASAQFTSSLVSRGQYLGVLGSLFLQFKPPSVALKVLPVTFPVAAPPINIVTLKNRALSPVAKMFVAFVRKIANPAATRQGVRATRRSRARAAVRPSSN
jgi:hypothetical protein